ncbi:uncharacterized protein LOC102808916 [Saccoglossus kowalevskii]|uniref:Uncharacterized protein LOC102808916 n=1 Tax=Saccoglossus kowalevskii TaxID=10224 RepID=A0ABM0MGT7_SACKO|nr:PREDICTED: uncharacterized protein LOC102808916 [Saccoglossus kowalevskii]
MFHMSDVGAKSLDECSAGIAIYICLAVAIVLVVVICIIVAVYQIIIRCCKGSAHYIHLQTMKDTVANSLATATENVKTAADDLTFKAEMATVEVKDKIKKSRNPFKRKKKKKQKNIFSFFDKKSSQDSNVYYQEGYYDEKNLFHYYDDSAHYFDEHGNQFDIDFEHQHHFFNPNEKPHHPEDGLTNTELQPSSAGRPVPPPPPSSRPQYPTDEQTSSTDDVFQSLPPQSPPTDPPASDW